MFNRLVLWRCIETVCPFRSGHGVCTVRLYRSIRRALRRDRFISRFWAAAIHFAYDLYSMGWDGIKSCSQWLSKGYPDVLGGRVSV